MDVDNKYGTLSIQNKLLSLLKDFDFFCRQNDIQYSLESGSLLGAVRHNGFIPWDDDLDVVLDRGNYCKLVKCFQCNPNDSIIFERKTKETLWIDRVRLKNRLEGDKEAPTIDIFIFDNTPNNRFAARIKKNAILALQGMMKSRLNLKKGSFVMRVCSLFTWLLGRAFPLNLKYSMYNRVSAWGNNKECRKGSCYNYIFSEIGVLYDSNILKRIIYHTFEDTEMPITAEYDHVLSTLYGDYMTLPDETKRVPQHS